MNGTVPCRSGELGPHVDLAGIEGHVRARGPVRAPGAAGSGRPRRPARPPGRPAWRSRNRPTGPQPNTATLSPGSTSAWFTACMPTPSGSASAAIDSGMPSGTRKRRPPLGDLADEQHGGQPALAGAVAHAAQLVVARVDDHPVAGAPVARPRRRLHSTTPAISWPRAIGSARRDRPCGCRTGRCRRCRTRRPARRRPSVPARARRRRRCGRRPDRAP